MGRQLFKIIFLPFRYFRMRKADKLTNCNTKKINYCFPGFLHNKYAYGKYSYIHNMLPPL